MRESTRLRKSMNFGKWQERRHVDTSCPTAKRPGLATDSALLSLGTGGLGMAGVAVTAPEALEDGPGSCLRPVARKAENYRTLAFCSLT